MGLMGTAPGQGKIGEKILKKWNKAVVAVKVAFVE
jgi:hypothetical protein